MIGLWRDVKQKWWENAMAVWQAAGQDIDLDSQKDSGEGLEAVLLKALMGQVLGLWRFEELRARASVRSSSCTWSPVCRTAKTYAPKSKK